MEAQAHSQLPGVKVVFEDPYHDGIQQQGMGGVEYLGIPTGQSGFVKAKAQELLQGAISKIDAIDAHSSLAPQVRLQLLSIASSGLMVYFSQAVELSISEPLLKDYDIV